MKREFLKELGLGGDQIEKIMAEHGKAVDKIRSDTADVLRNYALERLIGDSGTTSPEVLSKLISDFSEEEAAARISELKDLCPWLFHQQTPTFSAPCNALDEKSEPFRYGAGL